MKFPRTIYAIKHNQTKRIYIGSTAELEKRYRTHIYSLRKHKHPSKEMQKDFDLYGEDYTVFILGEIRNIDEKRKEYEMMKKYNTFDTAIGYNQGDLKRLKKESSVVMNVSNYVEGLLERE